MKIESGSLLSASTLYLDALGGTGSQGFADEVKPASAEASHCIGVRSPSRPFSFGQPSLADRIVYILNARRIGCSHPKFFAVIHLRCAARCEFEDRHELGDLVVVHAVAIAIPLTRLIMIAEKVLRLTVGASCFRSH